METLTPKTTIDRRGKTISTFVVFDAATHMDTMREGETIEVLTDDYEPLRRDVSAWCQTTGHVLVSSEQVTTGWRFLIEKRIPAAKDTKLAMVISPDGLEELLSPLGFALAAALEGIDVSLYVQGPAVRVLGRGFRPKLKGWARPFSRFAAAQMAASGHIPAQDKFRQLDDLGAHIYMCGPSMEHFKVKPDDLILDEIAVVEYLTFMAVMEEADIQLFV
jgi:predicted peroxiredoxin/TusA-related sulfurtransferase